MKILYIPNQYSQQRQFEKKSNIYPVLLAMEAEHYRRLGCEVEWNIPYISSLKFDKIITKPEGLPFLSLPYPDRVFTRAKEYTSGNYKYLPGTHIQVANGCWHGKCTFCVENGKTYEVRSLDSVCNELVNCKKLGFREIFDDSGTFPTGKWLEDFCRAVKGSDLKFGCNMRMVNVDYRMMKEAGFRMVLFGLESANQHTLDMIDKGVNVEDFHYIIKAYKAELEPHVGVMFGFPWESDNDAIRTLRLVHHLLRKGYAKTAQASFYKVPNVESKENHRKYVNKIYNVAYSPEFWFNKLKDIRNTDDIKYLWRCIKEGIYAKSSSFCNHSDTWKKRY